MLVDLVLLFQINRLSASMNTVSIVTGDLFTAPPEKDSHHKTLVVTPDVGVGYIQALNETDEKVADSQRRPAVVETSQSQGHDLSSVLLSMAPTIKKMWN